MMAACGFVGGFFDAIAPRLFPVLEIKKREEKKRKYPQVIRKLKLFPRLSTQHSIRSTIFTIGGGLLACKFVKFSGGGGASCVQKQALRAENG
jgi:hypothetical protein